MGAKKKKPFKRISEAAWAARNLRHASPAALGASATGSGRAPPQCHGWNPAGCVSRRCVSLEQRGPLRSPNYGPSESDGAM